MLDKLSHGNQTNSSHLIGQSAKNLFMMGLTDSLSDHVPQVPQHCHEWKRFIVYRETEPSTVFNIQCVGFKING